MNARVTGSTSRRSVQVSMCCEQAFGFQFGGKAVDGAATNCRDGRTARYQSVRARQSWAPAAYVAPADDDWWLTAHGRVTHAHCDCPVKRTSFVYTSKRGNREQQTPPPARAALGESLIECRRPARSRRLYLAGYGQA